MFCRQLLGNSTSSPIGWRLVFGPFPVAFLYPLRLPRGFAIAFGYFQRLFYILFAMPNGSPTAFNPNPDGYEKSA
jgi:hypothetical protein